MTDDKRAKLQRLEEQLRQIECGDTEVFVAEDTEVKKAIEKAMSLLSYQDRTKKELSERLYREGFSEKASQEAMEYAEHYGYVNDCRYVEHYIMFQQGKRSRREMIYKLREKGISRQVIESVFEEADYDGEESAICRAIEKRLKGRTVHELDFQEKQKVIAYLGRKGYDIHCVKNVFSKLDNNEKKV